MFLIPIDDERYHVNGLTEEECGFAEAVLCRVKQKYKALPALIDTALAPLSLSDVQKDALLIRVTLAFAHYIKISLPPKTQEEFDARIAKCFRAFLPYITENVAVMHAPNHVQFEPIMLTNLYISNQLYRHLTKFSPPEENSFDFWMWLEWIGFIRVLRSMLLLLTAGDDAHGMSLFRGALEIIAKLKLAERFSEEYPLFKEFNQHLQAYKHTKTPIPTEMADYLKNEPDYKRNRENFLAYGWAKDSSGKRFLGLKSLLCEAFPEKNEDMIRLFQITSEFVHEDYVGVGYDYVAIRKLLTDTCFWLYGSAIAEGDLLPFISKKERAQLCHLYSLAKPYYAGEFPLDGE